MGNSLWSRWNGLLGSLGGAAVLERPVPLPPARLAVPALGRALGHALDADGVEATIHSQVAGYALVQQLRSEVAGRLGRADGASLVCAVGVLAGQACQHGLRRAALANGLEPAQVLHEHRLGDGNTYYSGELLERVLLEQHPSLWSITAANARRAGLAPEALPNLGRLQARVQASRGTVDFGQLQQQQPVQPLRPPLEWLGLWPQVQQLLEDSALEPAQWQLALAMAARQVCREDAAALPPAAWLALLMESALVGCTADQRHRARA